MSNNTIAQIYFRNFGNFDLTQVMDKADLEGLDLPVQNTEATFVVTGDADAEIFSKVLIEKGLDKKGSYEMHTTIALKFIK
jgi:hypothetical protein